MPIRTWGKKWWGVFSFFFLFLIAWQFCNYLGLLSSGTHEKCPISPRPSLKPCVLLSPVQHHNTKAQGCSSWWVKASSLPCCLLWPCCQVPCRQLHFQLPCLLFAHFTSSTRMCRNCRIVSWHPTKRNSDDLDGTF